ncbi:hypothetical protein M378DRAFT_171716 [Amanita muscaria Koide BX008]|uniref:Uncharacterized protein n=1 Tax=Amanita muscaria (strain Koide BX008) TaxID=946122 RepID=A0A0C2WMN9_AMAMK|nr:hypothetical protein M378DRAFT_171716 [Amanita muscaria Koide BX008]
MTTTVFVRTSTNSIIGHRSPPTSIDNHHALASQQQATGTIPVCPIDMQWSTSNIVTTPGVVM